MEKEKFKLPSPIFSKVENKLPTPHFASAQGMLLPKEKQPPPMFGPNGATIPAKYLEKYKPYLEKYQKKCEETNAASKRCSQQTLWCENCDLQFRNKSQLDKHSLEYSKCTIGDCTFHGCSKSVAQHIQELHTTGLYDKIKNFNTPEEISKWREERKKRYPTMANVELRQKVQEERKKRGERIENNRNRFGPKNDVKKSNSNSSDSQMLKRKGQTKFEQFKKKKIDERRNNAATINNKSQRTNTDSVKNNTEEIIACSDEEEGFSNSNIPKFQGTSSISDYVSIRANGKNVVQNILTSLVGMYGDSSDSDEDLSNSDNEANDELSKKINQTENSIVNNIEKVVQDSEEKEPNNKNDENKSEQNDFDMKSLKDDVKNDFKMNIFKEEEIKAVSDNESEDIPDEGKLAIDLNPNISQNEENNKNICNLEKLIQNTEEKIPNKKNNESKSMKDDLEVKLLEDKSVVNDIRINKFEKKEEMKPVSDTESEDAPDQALIIRKLNNTLIPKILQNGNICNLEKVEQSKKDKLQNITVANDVKIKIFEKEGNFKAIFDNENEDAPDEEPIIRKLAIDLIPNISQNEENYKSICNLEKLIQTTQEKVLNKQNYESKSMKDDLEVKLLKDENVVNNVRTSTFEKKEEMKAVSDIENEDAPDEAPILRKLADELIPKPLNFPKESKIIKTIEKDKIHKDERFSHGGTRNGNNRKSKINSKIRKTGFLLDYSKLRKTPQNTLLEKLLEPQIRHERNVLLQCVRYVVNKNFFETNN